MVTLRSVEKRFEQMSVARSLSIWWTDRRAAAWQRRNPGRPFSEFYVARVHRQMAAGRPHPTLGNRGYSSEIGSGVEWDRNSFAVRGLGAWFEYRRMGVQPGMRCVDYGCGTLRVGQHAIRYLERGHYWGIDVTGSFMEQGKALLDAAMFEDKRPRLSLITDDLIDLLAVWQPHFIFSHTVVQHVPERELPVYFERLSRMMGPGSKAVIEFVGAPEVERFKAMSWAYPDETLAAVALAVDPHWSLSFEALPWADSQVRNKPRRFMVVTRA